MITLYSFKKEKPKEIEKPEITVLGAGETEVNGVYTMQGTRDFQPKFRKCDEHGNIFEIAREDDSNKKKYWWIYKITNGEKSGGITEMDLYQVSSQSGMPPEKGWKTINVNSFFFFF